MNHIIHDTDRDGWGSAALLLAQLSPDACRIYPTREKSISEMLKQIPVKAGDCIWVLDIPCPASWMDFVFTKDVAVKWVDHHLDAWKNLIPPEITIYLPSTNKPTTTMSMLVVHGLVSVPDAMSFAQKICTSQSVWAQVFDGLALSPEYPITLQELGQELANAPLGGSPSPRLRALITIVDDSNQVVAGVLDSSRKVVGDKWVITHLDDAQKIPLARYSLALGNDHYGKVRILVHRANLLYCGRDSQSKGPDILSHFKQRGLAAKGHSYVCFASIAAGSIDSELKALCEFIEGKCHGESI